MLRSVLSLRSRTIRHLGPWAVSAALFLVSGGHWATLQAVAWTGMLWNYSQEDGSVLAGAKKTFDGEHPCPMCKSIKAAKDKERTAPVVVVSLKKAELFPSPLRFVLPTRCCVDFAFPPLSDASADSRAQAPPSPVPIGALSA